MSANYAVMLLAAMFVAAGVTGADVPKASAQQRSQRLRGDLARSLQADLQPWQTDLSGLPPLAPESLTSPPPLARTQGRSPPPVRSSQYVYVDVAVHVIKRTMAPLQDLFNSPTKQATAKTASYICPGVIAAVQIVAPSAVPRPGPRNSSCTWLRNVAIEPAVFALVTFQVLASERPNIVDALNDQSPGGGMEGFVGITYLSCRSKIEVGKGLQGVGGKLGTNLMKATNAPPLSRPNVFYTDANCPALALPAAGGRGVCTVGL